MKGEFLEIVNPLLDPETIQTRKSASTSQLLMVVEFCVSFSSPQPLIVGKEDKLGLCNGPVDIGMGKISTQQNVHDGPWQECSEDRWDLRLNQNRVDS